VLATVVRLLETTRARIGNEEYARANESFGLTTLRERQVRVDGSRLRFRFRGKSGVEHAIELDDRRLAGIVRRMRDLPGEELFRYVDDDGETRRIESDDVNAYLKEISGEDFTSKDFRTWAGTGARGPCPIPESEPSRPKPDAKRNVVQAIEAGSRRARATPRPSAASATSIPRSSRATSRASSAISCSAKAGARRREKAGRGAAQGALAAGRRGDEAQRRRSRSLVPALARSLSQSGNTDCSAALNQSREAPHETLHLLGIALLPACSAVSRRTQSGFEHRHEQRRQSPQRADRARSLRPLDRDERRLGFGTQWTSQRPPETESSVRHERPRTRPPLPEPLERPYATTLTGRTAPSACVNSHVPAPLWHRQRRGRAAA
jgi:hypothetical protein